MAFAVLIAQFWPSQEVVMATVVHVFHEEIVRRFGKHGSQVDIGHDDNLNNRVNSTSSRCLKLDRTGLELCCKYRVN